MAGHLHARYDRLCRPRVDGQRQFLPLGVLLRHLRVEVAVVRHGHRVQWPIVIKLARDRDRRHRGNSLNHALLPHNFGTLLELFPARRLRHRGDARRTAS
eukprot:10243789-Lingulodinium_polyedra.AAC.1